MTTSPKRFAVGTLMVVLMIANILFITTRLAESKEMDAPRVQKPVEGAGWTLDKSFRFDPGTTYEVAFTGEKSRERLKSLVSTPVEQLNEMPEMKAAGIKFKFTDANHSTQTTADCSKDHRLVFTFGDWDIDKKPYAAYALGCSVFVSTDYWKLMPDYQKKNVVTHEFGHLIGLDHCTHQAGLNPVMCEEGEPREHEKYGMFRYSDLNGIRELIKRSN